MNEIDALLDDAEELLTQVRSLYEGSLASRNADALAPKIKSVLEHQRSALDYLANRLRTRYCPAPRTTEHVYYPLAFKAGKVNAAIDKNLPALRHNEPSIAKVIREYQPYNRPWLKTLITLVNPAKHETPVALNLGMHIPSRGGGGHIILPGAREEPPSAQSFEAGSTVPFAGGAHVDWVLTGLGRPMLPTLLEIQAELPRLLGAVRGVAPLV